MGLTAFYQAGNARFTFNVHPAAAPGPDGPGIYMFTTFNVLANAYTIHYVGQSESVFERLSSHERWAEARARGMTHVLRLTVENSLQRDEVEKLLIKSINPPMNTIHRPAPAGIFGFQVRR